MPRTGIMERRNVETSTILDLPVVCPAGERVVESIEGPACLCRIEQGLITAAKDPSSLARYCMAENKPGICGHIVCPTWQEARQAEWRKSDPANLIRPGGEDRAYSMDDLNEIAERENAGDFESANVLRREIIERKRERGLAPGIS